jgi:hypothetical protein
MTRLVAGISEGCARVLISLSRWERVGVRAYGYVDPN